MSALTGLMAANLGTEARRAAVTGMARAIKGRGQEPFASWGIEGEPVTLGIRQLLTLDLTPDGRQPTLSIQKPVAAILDGYIANAAALKRDLEEAGIKLRGHSDAELLVESVAHVGLNRLLQKLEGAFAFALWDGERQTLHLVRDRMGAKPLYVAAWQGAFAFSSDPAAFGTLAGFSPALNKSAISDLLTLGYVPAPKTLYEGIMALPAGHRLMLRPSDAAIPATEAWWSPVSAVEEIALRGKAANSSDARASRLIENLVEEAARLDVPYACLDDFGATARILKTRLSGRFDKTLRTVELQAPDAVAVQTAFDALVRLPIPITNPDAVPLWRALKNMREPASVLMAPSEWSESASGTEQAARPMRLPRPLARVAAKLLPQQFSYMANDASSMLETRFGLWPDAQKLTGTKVEWPIEHPRMPVSEEQLAAFNIFVGPFRESWLPMIDVLAGSLEMEARTPFADHRLLEYYWPSFSPSKADIGGWLRGPMRIRMQNTLNSGIFNLLQLKYPDPILVTWQNCLSGDNSKSHSLWGFLILVEWAAAHGLLHRHL